MVEGGKIDRAAHSNDLQGTILETLDFDEAIAVAYKFYQQHPDETLIVVTADHETGGTWLNYTGYEVGGSSPVAMSYSTRGHSGVVVPIFAYGEGAEAFAGVMKNTDIPKKIEQLMK